MILEALLLSLQVTAVATAVVAVAGTLLGLVLARARFPGRHLLEAVAMLPLVLPPTVVGYYLLLFLGSGGPPDRLLGARLVFSWPAAAFASAVMALPLMVQAARASIAGVDPVLENAARTLGSSEPEVFFRITLPLAKRGLVAGLILSGARALGEFGATLMVAGNIPGRTQTLPLLMYDAVQNQDYRMANLLVVGLSAFSFVSLVAVRRLGENER